MLCVVYERFNNCSFLFLFISYNIALHFYLLSYSNISTSASYVTYHMVALSHGQPGSLRRGVRLRCQHVLSDSSATELYCIIVPSVLKYFVTAGVLPLYQQLWLKRCAAWRHSSKRKRKRSLLWSVNWHNWKRYERFMPHEENYISCPNVRVILPVEVRFYNLVASFLSSNVAFLVQLAMMLLAFL